MTIQLPNPDNPATTKQIQRLIDLAYTNCQTDWEEIQGYVPRFKAMTCQQASDLISVWDDLHEQRAMDWSGRIVAPMDLVGNLVTPPSGPAQPAPAPAPQPTGQVPRIMYAKFDSICSICHQQIRRGDSIRYKHGFYATHNACGDPQVRLGQSNLPKQPVITPTPIYTYYTCRICGAQFSTSSDHQDHIDTVHLSYKCHLCSAAYSEQYQLDNHMNAAHNVFGRTPDPAMIPPDKGYYAVMMPENNKVVWRFYCVTVARTKFYNSSHPLAGEKIRTFWRIAGDNKLPVRDPAERKLAIAQIKAAPDLAMKEYGRKVGRCGICHKQLTDPESIARGIGPECIKTYAGRFI